MSISHLLLCSNMLRPFESVAGKHLLQEEESNF